MDQTTLLEAAQQLIRIASTYDDSDGLYAALDFIRNILRNSGKSITIEEFESNGKPSLLAYRSGQRPDKFHIILNGHVDVVPAPAEQFEPYIKDDKLYGRGAYDMKIASLILTDVFCEFVDKMPYALGLQIVTDEEASGVHGTNYQISQGVRADFIICSESGRATNAHEIANEAKGNCAAAVTFKGTSAHGAYPWRGDNAALKAAHFATRLHERYPIPAEETDQTTVTLTSIITHDSVHNRVPDTAVATLDMRYIAGDTHFDDQAAVVALLKDIDPIIDHVDFVTFTRPILTSPKHPILLALRSSAERVERHAFSLVRRNATSDGRFYGEIGAAVCEFGIAGENQHGDNEYVPLAACFNFQATMRDFLSRTITEKQIAEDASAVDPSASV